MLTKVPQILTSESFYKYYASATSAKLGVRKALFQIIFNMAVFLKCKF